MTDPTTRPPIPPRLAYRPVVGGLAAPYVNSRLADGGVDFLSPHTASYERCWKRTLCQACGVPIPATAVLFGGPGQLRELHFDEPPLHAECAEYAARACPMVSGRMPAYASHAPMSAGKRGQVCSRPGCDCGGWQQTDPDMPGHAGEPAHPYFAVYVTAGRWQLTARENQYRCTDGGCDKLHTRTLLNGAYLTGPPSKIIHVSTPGDGVIWQQLTPAGIAALVTDPWYARP